MPIDSNENRGYPHTPHNHSGGVWVDCVLDVIGWFQISEVLNPSTGNYVPEMDAYGQPMSGPGWVAYEKPGASPGDIVIIYRLKTLLAQGTAPNQTQIGSVLWQLLNPNGLCYFTTDYGLKSCVSPSDLVTAFPHPGGVLSPVNPDNSSGDPDVLWKRVTTQYQLPGPGNSMTPQLIRQVLPGFGVRMLVWTPDCCVHHAMTMQPPVPPITPPVPPLPVASASIPGSESLVSPSLPGNIIGSVTPVTDSTGAIAETLNPFPGAINPAPYTGHSSLTGDPVKNMTAISSPGAASSQLDPSGGDRLPLPGEYSTQVYGTQSCHRPGSAPPPRPGNPQSTYYNVSNSSALPFQFKVSENDFSQITRATPFGGRYMQIKEAGRDPALMKSRINWLINMDQSTLEALGLATVSPRQGARAQVGSFKVSPTPGGKSANTTSTPIQRPLDRNHIRSPNSASDPIRRHGNTDNQPAIEQTVGGYSHTPIRSLSSVTPETSESIRSSIIGGQKISIRNRGKILSRKLQKQTEKGDQLKDQASRLGHASLRRRTIDVSRAVQGTRAGQYQQAALKNSGPNISDLKIVRDVVSFEDIKDPNDQFRIVPVSFRGGDEWAFMTLVIGEVPSEKRVVLNQTAMLHTDDGVITANLGSSGCMQFGKVNPVLPGMYVVANPSCIPGQGSLPNIIAGGRTWNFMTLVLTLIRLDGALVAQQVMNFLPAFGGDTDVVAPNRLPFGLMRDLEMTQSSDFLYDGTYNARANSQDNWYQQEPSVIVERTGPVTESTAVVLKATVTSQGQNSAFRPLMEIYDDTVLQSSGSAAAFVSGPCSANMGWTDPTNGQAFSNGGLHTACPGRAGTGGVGGTSAYTVDGFGVIQSGPYNQAVYGGSHHCFLYFRYDPVNPSSSESNNISASGTKYRIRVYNNGPVSNSNGYVLYTQGLKISAATGSLTLNSSGEVTGTLTTYHCSQVLRVRNDTTGQEVERLSSWETGSIYLGSSSTIASRLSASIGDVIKVYRPGYDNSYSSGLGSAIAQYTVT